MDELHNRGSPRLQFTKDELENDTLSKPIARVEKAADKYDAPQKKLKKSYRLKLTREEGEVKAQPDGHQTDDIEAADIASTDEILDRDTGIRTDPHAPGVQNTRRRPESRNKPDVQKQSSSQKAPGTAKTAPGASSVDKKPVAEPAKKKSVRLKFEETQTKKPSRMTHPVEKTIRSVGDQLHRQAVQSNEDDNVAVDAVLQADQKAETALQMGEHAYHAHKMRPYKRLAKAEKRLDKANIRVMEKQYQQEHPQFTSNPYSRWQQKRAIRREYAAAKRGASGRTVQNTAKSAEKATEKVGDAAGKTVEAIRRHPTILLILALGGMLLIVMSSLQSCTPLAQSVLESVVIGTYPATEDDVRAAERVYAEKERKLKKCMVVKYKYHRHG